MYLYTIVINRSISKSRFNRQSDRLYTVHQITTGQAATCGTPTAGIKPVGRTEKVVNCNLWDLWNRKFPAAVRAADDIRKRESAGAVAGSARRKRWLLIRGAFHLGLQGSEGRSVAKRKVAKSRQLNASVRTQAR